MVGTHPANNQARKIISSFEVLDNPVGWDINQDIWNVKHKQNDVKLGSI
jgi:hypothetical protein